MASNQKKVAGGFAVAMAAAMPILIPFLKTHEGLSLKAYLDAARVWTACYGHAYVEPGTTVTPEQCDDLLASDTGIFMKAVYDALKYEPSSFVLAAHTSFAFNIGVAGYRRSSTLRLTNEGRAKEGCRAMTLWYKSGGADCRPRDSGCYGLWTRRLDEVGLCLSGLK